MSEVSANTALRAGVAYAILTGDRLTVGNDRFRRVWRVEAGGGLIAESFADHATGAEWLVAPPPLDANPTPPALSLVALPAVSAVAAPSLTAQLTVAGESTYRLQIFPGVGGVRLQHRRHGKTSVVVSLPETAEAAPTGVEQDPVPQASPPTGVTEGNDVLDTFTLAPLHLYLTQVIFHDQTDQHNELVAEQNWLLHTSEQALFLPGCLFYVEDVLTGAGLIYLKEAPLPYARPVPSPHDLQVEPRERRFTVVGHAADDEYDYAFVTLAYAGGTAGRIAALQHYGRCLRPYQSGRDGVLLANTWGDRNRDGRINADFLAQEIEAGARLGVDVIQIDDGWQAGATSNSVRAHSAGGVWEGFWAAHENFWAVNAERFPGGLEPLTAAAQDAGMGFGLWFGPDSAHDFGNWQRDANALIGLHQNLGVNYFKLDGIKVRSKIGERNLRSFADRVLDETAGRVTFDLDITAEVRPGYFGLMDVGPLFVENRYTDWRRYWPHQTLRTLWQLSHHIDPVRLRLEWLNHARNQEKYAGDPLAPAAYRPDYLFATVMLSSPLGWFEVSSLPPSYLDHAAPLIKVWKQHRDALHEGVILPIGDAPNGVSWTGFVALTADGAGAYLLLFRELNRQANWSLSLPFLPDVAEPITATGLGGDGSATLLPGRILSAAIDAPQHFLFAHLRFRDHI